MGMVWVIVILGHPSSSSLCSSLASLFVFMLQGVFWELRDGALIVVVDGGFPKYYELKVSPIVHTFSRDKVEAYYKDFNAYYYVVVHCCLRIVWICH